MEWNHGLRDVVIDKIRGRITRNDSYRVSGDIPHQSLARC